MRFSIIIPVYNDSDGLSQTLSSLLDLKYDGDYEIIVVDNDSSDETLDVATDVASREDNVIVAVEDQVQSSYAARNRGIKHASGDILAFMDADMTVDEDWLQQLNELYIQKEVDYVGCNVKIYLPDGEETIFGKYNVAHGFPVKMYLQEMNFAPTCCLSVRREVINQVGDFVAELESGGNKEFGNRVAESGYSQTFASHITMYHPARTTFAELVSKSKRIGRGREQRYHLASVKGGRPWYQPRNFMPPHPGRFKDRLSEDLGVKYLLTFYIISSILKIIKSISQVEYRIGLDTSGW